MKFKVKLTHVRETIVEVEADCPMKAREKAVEWYDSTEWNEPYGVMPVSTISIDKKPKVIGLEKKQAKSTSK